MFRELSIDVAGIEVGFIAFVDGDQDGDASFLALFIASMVWLRIPSSPAMTRTTRSVTIAPRSRIEEKAS